MKAKTSSIIVLISDTCILVLFLIEMFSFTPGTSPGGDPLLEMRRSTGGSKTGSADSHISTRSSSKTSTWLWS